MNETLPPQALSREVWSRPFVKAHQRWCDDFVLELRLRDVPGPVIGERLGEVEAHCAETGETPLEVFGDPTDYARKIDEDGSRERVGGVWVVAALSAAQVLATLVGTVAVQEWSRSAELTYNAAQVGCLGLILLVLLSLPWLLRPLVRHPWALGLPLFALLPLAAGVAAVFGRSDLPVVVSLPAPAVSVGLFVVVLVLAWFEHRELGRDAGGDLVTSPLAPTSERSSAPGKRALLSSLVPALLIPISYLVLAAVFWVLA